MTNFFLEMFSILGRNFICIFFFTFKVKKVQKWAKNTFENHGVFVFSMFASFRNIRWLFHTFERFPVLFPTFTLIFHISTGIPSPSPSPLLSNKTFSSLSRQSSLGRMCSVWVMSLLQSAVGAGWVSAAGTSCSNRWRKHSLLTRTQVLELAFGFTC